MVLHIVQFTALFLLMLVTGVFWGPWFSLHRSIGVFSQDVFIQIVKTMSRNLAIGMRILMPGSILFLVLSTWLYPLIPSAGFYSCVVALVFNMIALVITIFIEVPIINQIMGWHAENIPSNWQSIRDRWRFFHVIRTVASLISFSSLLISILL